MSSIGRPEANRSLYRSFDPRDVEIERLKKECEELRARERMASAEREELHRRLTFLSGTSKSFASSMRGRANERQRYRHRLVTLYALSRVLGSARDMNDAAPGILEILGERLGWDAGVFWRVDANVLRCNNTWLSWDTPSDAFQKACRRVTLSRGEGLPGRAWMSDEPIWAEDILGQRDPLREAAADEGLRGILAFPVRDGGLFGVFEFFRRGIMPLDEDMLQTVIIIGHQIGHFAERRRAERARDRSLVREREARRELTGILESISDAFFAVDREWRLTYVNRSAEQLWSRSREDLIGKNLWELFPRAVNSELYRAMEEMTTTSFEAIFPIMNVWIAGRAYPSPNGISVYLQDVTERKKLEEERERLLALEWVASAQIAERERISRELHDRVAHSMGVVHQNLQLHEALAGRDPSRANSKLKLAQKMATVALESTRNLSAELLRSEIEDDLAGGLRDLLEVVEPPGIQAELSVEGDESIVPGHVRGQIFLILREAVRNAITHSGCTRITVGLEIIPDKVVGCVEDDGRGFDAEEVGAAGVGLRSMKERTVLLGGKFRLAPGPGVGTKVTVSIPLTPGSDSAG
jgi:PAS domain S-box-containing protein